MTRKLTTFALATLLFSPLVACSVEQTEEGEMPDVEVQGGDLPAYDVDAPDVDVTTEPTDVTVPDVDVTTEEETIELPEVDVTAPGEAGYEDDDPAADAAADEPQR